MDLNGKLLVATPTLDDSIFDKGLIYILGHDNNGTLGVMINKPLAEIKAEQIAKELKLGAASLVKKKYLICNGGPVETEEIFILSYTSLLSGLQVDEGQPLSLFKNTQTFFRDLLTGVIDVPFLIVQGYASWAERATSTLH